ncbi:MAG: sialidase family protein [Candidatus Thermoplasmatota archaeon]|nr:sialidase family protein [Candidatus Thermoplasmatota archaeon]
MAWKARAVALLLFSVALTGCIGSEDDPLEAQQVPDPVEALLSFAEDQALPMDIGAAEPNLAIHPDGTLFITAPVGAAEKPNALEGAAWLWRSTDGGQTWETLRDPHIRDEATVPEAAPFPGVFCSCDADVVTSPDGWTYYSDWWIAGFLGPGNYLVEASPDAGETWQPMPVTIPHIRSVDRQWLIAGEDGFVGLFYSYFGTVPVSGIGPDTPVNGRAIQAVFSHDHGQTWSLPVDVVAAGPNEAFQIAHPRILPDGTLIMPYGYVDVQEDFFTDLSEVRVAISQDQGETWEQVSVADVPEGFENLWAVQGAVDDAGNAYIAWAARTGETMTLFVSESQDQAATWSDAETIRGQGLNFLPWVAARGDGQVAVGWYGGDATGDPTEASDDATWYAYVAERAAPGEPFTVAKVSDQPVKTGPMCPSGAVCGEDRELLDYVSLDYDPAGDLHYAFARSNPDTPGLLPAVVHHAAEV